VDAGLLTWNVPFGDQRRVLEKTEDGTLSTFPPRCVTALTTHEAPRVYSTS